MKCVKLPISMTLLSDTIFSSGFSIPGGEDISLKTGSDDLPVFAGSTLKGLFRESLENYLTWTNTADSEAEIERLLGNEEMDIEKPERIVFTDMRTTLEQGSSDWYSTRSFTSMENGRAKDHTLRLATCIHAGLCFYGALFCDISDLDLIKKVLRGIQYAGLLRNRGFGHVKFTYSESEDINTVDFGVAKDASCLRYRLTARTPLSLLRASVPGGEKVNFSETFDYLPGRVMRGAILSLLPHESEEQRKIIRNMMTHVRFGNALPVIDGMGSIPTPRGFYEDKLQTHLYNVLLEDVRPGDKRASMGGYSIIQDGKLVHMTPKIESQLRIRRQRLVDKQEKEVFTTMAIAPGTVLEGVITADMPHLLQIIGCALKQTLWLGSDRFAGNGLCEIKTLGDEKPAYASYGFSSEDRIPKRVYMLLLSPAVMKRSDEYACIDADALSEKLDGVKVRLGRCATSIEEVVGFNRLYRALTDAEVMYAQGSLFTLEFPENPPSAKSLLTLQASGIGERREEGCGSILFLKDFEKIRGSEKFSEKAVNTIKTASQIRQIRCQWIMNNDLPKGPSASQYGNIQALCENIASGNGKLDDLNEFFEHNLMDRGTVYADRFTHVSHKIQTLIKTDLSETLGCAAFENDTADRLLFISEWIDFRRKEG